MRAINIDDVVTQFCVEAGKTIDLHANFSIDTSMIEDTADVILSLQKGDTQVGVARGRVRGSGDHQPISMFYKEKVTEDTLFRLLIINLDP